jgi:hypothetical protein
VAFEQKPNTGALFRNDQKEAETHADYRGDCTIDGKQYYINSWLKEGKGGKKYMSLSFKPKQARQGNGRQQDNRARDTDPGFDDSIPF